MLTMMALYTILGSVEFGLIPASKGDYNSGGLLKIDIQAKFSSGLVLIG